jgi:hypothetical protein
MTLNGVYELEKRRKVGTDLGFPVHSLNLNNLFFSSFSLNRDYMTRRKRRSGRNIDEPFP